MARHSLVYWHYIFPASLKILYLEGGTSSNDYVTTEASLSECIPLFQVYSADLLWSPMPNVLSSHRYTLYFCILGYFPSHKHPTEHLPTCNTEPIWKRFQLHTVPISLLNIFNKMIKPNGRKHKLLNKQIKHKTVLLRFAWLVQSQLSSWINIIFNGHLRTLTFHLLLSKMI